MIEQYRARIMGPEPLPADDAARRALADRISEEVMQLLYTAHQDLAELASKGGPIDPELVQSAQECTLGAISILRVVASSVLTAAWGAGLRPMPSDASWPGAEGLLFNALSDAWIVTCADRDLLFASGAACELLGRSNDELSSVFRDKRRLPAFLDAVERTVGDDGTVAFEVEVPLPGDESRCIGVLSHPLPPVPGVKQSYLSLLSERM